MPDVMSVLERLNQGLPLAAKDAAVIADSSTAGVVKSAVLSRLLCRPPTTQHVELTRQLAIQLPVVAASLHRSNPKDWFAPDLPEIHPDPLVVRVLRSEWLTPSARRNDLQSFLTDFLRERLPAEQVAAWLGTVVECGLSNETLTDLTHTMRDSGRVFDYRGTPRLAGRKLIRRYPTGGLSEKTALILPSVLVCAAARHPIASNFLVARSLGFTGGTWDKLSSIPGFRFPLPGDESIDVMSRCGVAMTVTHGDLNPADRKLYQMRSATGTIESHELIVASIASKQLAVPADHLLLDVRYGEGAFLRNAADARRCADAMITVITAGGVACSAHLTDTPQPNGMAIGNALEVAEALAVMGFTAPGAWDHRALREQRELVITFYGLLMSQGLGIADMAVWREEAAAWIDSGEVARAFELLLESHGVECTTIDGLRRHPFGALGLSEQRVAVTSLQTGFILRMDQRRMGHLVNFLLGGGGNEYGGAFCARAGIQLAHRIGDSIAAGQPLCWVFGETAPKSDFIDAMRECFIVE